MSSPNGSAPKTKTYTELRDEASAHWRDVALARQGYFTRMQQAINESPDVKMRPDPEQPWSCEGIDCPECGWSTFNVTRWVTVNGVRHRFEAVCRQCNAVHTYDWNMGIWVD